MPNPSALRERRKQKPLRSSHQAVLRFITVSALYLLGTGNAAAANCTAPVGIEAGHQVAVTPVALEDIERYALTPSAQRMATPQWSPQSLLVKARDLLAQGQQEQAKRWATAAMECGSSEAIVMLIEQSLQDKQEDQARKYLEIGLKNNIPEAKFLLAEQYDQGAVGFPKDRNQAFQWYHAAAKHGNAKAMQAVAYYFVRGYNGAQSDLAAIHWYHKSMMAGNVEAMTAYAWMLENGKGTSVDIQEAVYYYQKATSLGDSNAAEFLYKYRKRQG